MTELFSQLSSKKGFIVSKISIIIPVYKVEPYLEKCIESILNQTYKNLEIILVDDGSPDNCPEICDKYARKDNRIIVIHKDNGGLSEARNYGLNIATGDYILFVDSDDYIRHDMCEIMLKNAIETKANMVVCDYYLVQDEMIIEKKDNELKKEILNSDQYMHRFIFEKNICYVVAWLKLYERSLFKDLRFPVGVIHEDEFMIHKIVYRCSLISCIPEKLYFYVKRENSITTSQFSAKNMDAAYAALDQYWFSKSIKNNELKNFNVRRLSEFLLIYKQHLDNSECYMKYNDLTRRVRFLAFERDAWKNVAPRGRLYYRFEILFPNAMNLIYKGYRKIFKNKK